MTMASPAIGAGFAPAEGNGHGGGPGDSERLVQVLGWISVGLGVAQLVAPDRVSRLTGLPKGRPGRTRMRFMGAREMGSGLSLLARSPSPVWLWARVAGDLFQVGLLGHSMRASPRSRRRLAIATTAVAGIALLDYLAARQASRAREGAGAARRGRGIQVREAITVNRPPEEVYSFWRDFGNLPRFMAHLESVEVLDSRRSHWTANAPAGTTVEWDAEIIEERENELIAWRSLQHADVDNRGTVRFTPAPGGRGTEILVELRYLPPGGALGAAVAKLFGEEPSQQVKSDLRRLKQVLETGEVVHSDASIHRGMHPARPPEPGSPPTDRFQGAPR